MASVAKKSISNRSTTQKKDKPLSEARQKLMAYSQMAKERKKMMLAKCESDVEALEIMMLSINNIVISFYEADNEGANEWSTFKQWGEKGYKIKKGSKAFHVWGKPVKAVNKSGADVETEGGDEVSESKYKYWPMCGLFNNLQVEKREEQPEDAPEREEQKDVVKVEEKKEAALVKVKVADFRESVQHLERLFNVDRHACVGDKEKAFWKKRCLKILAEVESLTCSRAKPEDLEERERIVSAVREYLAQDNEPEPTPPTITKRKKTKPQAVQGGEVVALESRQEAASAQAVALVVVASEEGENRENPFICQNFQGKQDARKDRLEDRAANAAHRSQENYTQGHKMAEHIPFGQPILVGHHSEQRDRAYRGRIVKKFDKSLEEGKKAQHYSQRASQVGRGGIASDDPEALKKLKEKLTKKEALQTQMKAANKALKKGDDEALKALGFNDGHIKLLKEPEVGGRPGFPAYRLTNNSAEIRRLKGRIAELEKLYDSEPLEVETEDYKIFIDDGRVHVEFFGGKPSEEVRTLLKRSYQFKFSRYSGTWTRKATQAGLYMGESLVKELEQVASVY